MKKTDFTATVKEQWTVSKGFSRLVLIADQKGTDAFADCVPGQFLELSVSNMALPDDDIISESLAQTTQKSMLLRRPFSFTDVRKSPTATEIEILYGIVGPGTLRMNSLKPGDKVSIIGPLGNGFTVPQEKTTALLIGGGTGTPPVQHLSKYLKENYSHINTTVFIGAKSSDNLPVLLEKDSSGSTIMKEFADIGINSQIATDDGSVGFKGVVTQAVREFVQQQNLKPESTIIYACGPRPMLESAAKLANEFNIDSQLSTERMMACGIGLCQSCAIEVKKPHSEDFQYKLCCKDGPIFDGKELIF